MTLVSIIIPVFNAERYLPATLASVRQQTFSDWECIMVDDGSTDGSYDLACRLAAEDERVRVIRKENGGVGSARNAGAAERSSDCRLVPFLDAGDLLELDTSLKHCEDWDLWLRLSMDGGFVFVNEYVIRYRWHLGGKSRRKKTFDEAHLLVRRKLLTSAAIDPENRRAARKAYAYYCSRKF